MVGVAVRQDDEIEIGEVNALRLDVGGEDVAVVAGVEQDSLAGDLDERGEAPILLHRGVGAEGVVEDRDLAGGLSRRDRRRRNQDAAPASAAARNKVVRSVMEVPPLRGPHCACVSAR